MLTDQQKLAREIFVYEMRKQKGEPVKGPFRKRLDKTETRYYWAGLAFEVMRKNPPTFSFETAHTPEVEIGWYRGIPHIEGISLAAAVCEWLGITRHHFHAMIIMNETTNSCWDTLANVTHTLPPPEEEKE